MGAAVVVAAIAVSAAVLLSDDETVRQQVGLQVISLQVHGDGLDPRYATAARLTVVGAVTKPGATPATSGSPSWLEVLEGAPAQLVRAYTQQVADGPPMGEAHRVMSSAPRWRQVGRPRLAAVSGQVGRSGGGQDKRGSTSSCPGWMRSGSAPMTSRLAA